MPCCRHSSAVASPASPCFKIVIICSSLCRVPFICVSPFLGFGETHILPTWHTFRGLGHYHKTRERICELCSKLGGSNGFVYDSNESRLFQVTCACPDIMRSSEGLIHE